MTTKTYVDLQEPVVDAAWLNDVDALRYDADGANPVRYTPVGSGSTARTLLSKFSDSVSVKDFGAAGDGVTDDRAAINTAFAFAVANPGTTLVFPAGSYYLGTGLGTYAQIELGVPTVGGIGATHVKIQGYGATLLQGRVGKVFGVYNANRVAVEGLKIFGYTGGTLDSTRENDACITINYSSSFVTIKDCYLTNSLGDCIYAGGTLVSGGETGSETRSLSIKNCVLKTRVGNDVASFSGGTKSRLALALIDVIGCEIAGNTIYGGVDLEPNLNGQHIVDVHVHGNTFAGGNVTPQAVIGTNYNYDEPINSSGGTVINGYVYLTGVPGSPVVSNNVVENNIFTDGTIWQSNVYVFGKITGNQFSKGQIISGDSSGPNDTTGSLIAYNKTNAPRTGATTFIFLKGNHTLCVFSNNTANIPSGYCINNNGASTGDAGRCCFNDNINYSATGISSIPAAFSFATTSTYSGNNSLESGLSWGKYSAIAPVSVWNIMVTSGISGTNQTLDWNILRGNLWYLTQTVSTATSIADIINEPGDGFELTINADASGGGGSLTIIHNSAKIRLKGSANALMVNGQYLTLVSRAGIWFEKSRSF